MLHGSARVERSEPSVSSGHVGLICLAVGVLASAFDLLWFTAVEGDSTPHAGVAAAAFASAALLVAALFAALWMGGGKWLARILRRPEHSVLETQALFFLLAYAVLMPRNRLTLDAFSWPGIVVTLPMVTVCLLAAHTAQQIASRAPRRLRDVFWRSTPFLALAVYAAYWAEVTGSGAGSGYAAAVLAAALTPVSIRFGARAATGGLVVLLLAASCWGAWTVPRRLGIPPNNASAATPPVESTPIILLTIDTLRWDVISAFNPKTTSTPSLDRLANDSLLFPRSYSASSWTVPSVASLLTGLAAGIHRVDKPGRPLPPEAPTLAERLRESGYVTGAVITNPLLLPQVGFERGFETFLNLQEPGIGAGFGARILSSMLPKGFLDAETGVVLDHALEWLDEYARGAFFLWVHFLDPHVPYSPPERFLKGRQAPPSMDAVFDAPEQVRGGKFLTAEEREWIWQLYLAEVEYVDEAVGALLDRLRELGLYDGALIIVTSDHGEEFWEHGGFEHGHAMYEETVRVPLMIKLPDSTETGVRAEPVANWQIYWTLLDFAGLPPGNECVSMPSLLDFEEGSYRSTRLALEGALYYQDLAALIEGDHKLIHWRTQGAREVYDLSNDPGETNPLPEGHPASALLDQEAEAAEQLEQIRACLGISESQPLDLRPATIERLRSIGYLR